MECIAGYLVVAEASDFKPILMYGRPTVDQNEPTEQFLLNGLHPLDNISAVGEVKQFLFLNDNIVQLGVLYFEMQLANDVEEISMLRDAPSSVFTVDYSRHNDSRFKIFGPRVESELVHGFDSRCELSCNGFVPFGPVTAEPGNDCFWSMSEFARQGCTSRVRAATWEHRWIQPLTSINK